MAASTKDVDVAMRIFLGGPFESGAIQIGDKEKRLAERYPESILELKTTLELILDAAVDWARTKGDEESDTIYSWLSKELPNISEITRAKIAAHVIYCIEH